MSENDDLIIINDTHEEKEMDDQNLTASDSEQETIVIVDDDNDITSTPSVKRRRPENGSLRGDEAYINNGSNVNNNDLSASNDSSSSKAPPENPFKRIKFVNETLSESHKDVRRMRRRDLEELVKKKVIEVVVYKEEIGTMHRKVLMVEAEVEKWKKQAQLLNKSLMALKVVQHKFMKDVVKSGGTTLVAPVKVCRNVGLNVGTCKLTNDNTIQDQDGDINANVSVGEKKACELGVNKVIKDKNNGDCVKSTEDQVINKPSSSCTQQPSTAVNSEQMLEAGENKPEMFLVPASPVTRSKRNNISEQTKITAKSQTSKSQIQSTNLNSQNKEFRYDAPSSAITRSKAAASKKLLFESESSSKPRSAACQSSPLSELISTGSEPKSTLPEIMLTRASSKQPQSIDFKKTEAVTKSRVSEAKSLMCKPTGSLNRSAESAAMSNGSVRNSTGPPSTFAGSATNSSSFHQNKMPPKTPSNMHLINTPPATPNTKHLEKKSSSYVNNITMETPPSTPDDIFMKETSTPNIAHLKSLPPAPKLDIRKNEKGVTISWDMDLDSTRHEKIISYEIYIYERKPKSASSRRNRTGTKLPIPGTEDWTKLASCTSLVLPMALDLNWDNRLVFNHHFAVRAQDQFYRLGPFSAPI